MGAAVVMTVLPVMARPPAAASPTATGGRTLGMARAERTARAAVLAHPSYRQIRTRRTGLVKRSCWRVPAGSVRCSFYVVVPSPCALRDNPAGVCAQALWERRWLVEVKPGRATAAHIVRISTGPSASG